MSDEVRAIIEAVRGEPIPEHWDLASGGAYTRELWAPDAAAANAINRQLSATTELPWSVLVNASGGWCVLARFADEAAAWSYGYSQLEARVRYGGECRGHKDGLRAQWGPCDRRGPCSPPAEGS